MAQTNIFTNQDHSAYIVECLNPIFQRKTFYLRVILHDNREWSFVHISNDEGNDLIHNDFNIQLDRTPGLEFWFIVVNIEAWIFSHHRDSHIYDDLTSENILKQNQNPNYREALGALAILNNPKDFELRLWKNHVEKNLFYISLQKNESDIEIPRSYYLIQADGTAKILYLQGQPGIKESIFVGLTPDWELIDSRSEEYIENLIGFLSGLWKYYVANLIDFRTQALFHYICQRTKIMIDTSSISIESPNKIAEELSSILDDYFISGNGLNKNYFISDDPFKFILSQRPNMRFIPTWLGWGCFNKHQALQVAAHLPSDMKDLSDHNRLNALGDNVPCIIIGSVY